MTSAASFIVSNRDGIHVRPAVQIARLAASHPGDVRVCLGPEEADAKSVMSLLLLAAAPGARLDFIVEGADAAELFSKLEQLFSNRFGRT